MLKLKKIPYSIVIENRVLELGKKYVLCKEATVRTIAKDAGISKSTVHKNLTERLKNIDGALYEEVYNKLNQNKEERASRGGIAAKQKSLSLKQSRV